MRKILSHHTRRKRGACDSYDLVITLGSGKRQNANRTVTIAADLLEDREPVGNRLDLVRAVLEEVMAAQEAT